MNILYHVVTPVGVKHTLEYKRGNKSNVTITHPLIKPCSLKKRWQMFLFVLCNKALIYLFILLSFTILIHFSYHQAKLTILRHNQSKKLPYSIYLSILSRTHHGFLHFSSVHHTDKHVCRQPLP